MKLHFSSGSPYARKVRIVLLEKGLPFTPAIRDGVPLSDAWPGPTRAVPVLEDREQTIWESDLIVDYLMRTYPDAKGPVQDPPLAPWLARPDRHWEDMTTLATISTCAHSMINLRFMAGDGITPENSDYLVQQRARVNESLDWLENKVTEEGFVPGWFSIMDIAFICPMVYCEKRAVMNWRGRPKLERLYERYQTRPSMLATPLPDAPPVRSRYVVERKLAS